MIKRNKTKPVLSQVAVYKDQIDKAYLFVKSQSTIFSKTNQDVSRIKPGPEVIKCL